MVNYNWVKATICCMLYESDGCISDCELVHYFKDKCPKPILLDVLTDLQNNQQVKLYPQDFGNVGSLTFNYNNHPPSSCVVSNFIDQALEVPIPTRGMVFMNASHVRFIVRQAPLHLDGPWYNTRYKHQDIIYEEVGGSGLMIMQAIITHEVWNRRFIDQTFILDKNQPKII